MVSSENPPATKRHKQRHKREELRTSQKCKGPHDKDLCHAGRQESGEGGIRTLDILTDISVFETDAFNRSATSPESEAPAVGSFVSLASIIFSRGFRGLGEEAAPFDS